MSLAEFHRVLDALVRAERQIDLLNLSGGEPLLHSDLLAFIDAALARPEVVRVSISTNGLRFLRDPDLLRALCDRNVVLSLQFDGFDDKAYQILRGHKLLDSKLRILDLIGAAQGTASLIMTAAAGLNDDQFPAMIDTLFSRDYIVSMMVQPVAFVGRASSLRPNLGRMTIPDVIHALDQAGHPAVRGTDFVPLPCSHPLCFSAAFYLMLDDGRAVAVNRLADVGAIMDALANRVVFGLDPGDPQKLKDLAYELWSGPLASAPDTRAVTKTLRRLLDATCGCNDPRAMFCSAERHVKSIFIHAFQDAATFDLARVRRCCQAYPQPDGKLVPACVRNVIGGGLRRG